MSCFEPTRYDLLRRQQRDAERERRWHLLRATLCFWQFRRKYYWASPKANVVRIEVASVPASDEARAEFERRVRAFLVSRGVSVDGTSVRVRFDDWSIRVVREVWARGYPIAVRCTSVTFLIATE